MSSFTILIKNEICQKSFDDHCQNALLAAVLRLSGTINSDQTSIKIQNFHQPTINLLLELLKNQYMGINVKLITNKYKNNNRYSLVIGNFVAEIINNYNLLLDSDLYLTKNNLKSHCFRAYIAGIFLVSGSINSPKTSNYHLELQFNEEKVAKIMQKVIFKKFKLQFKLIIRRKKYVLYLKKSNDISDFLKILDCPQAVFSFEDQRIARELLNTINRFNNIDISNQQKSIVAGLEQVDMIKNLIEKGSFNQLSSKCQVLAKLRLKYQDASLIELGNLYYQETGEIISKSGVNHLMRELKKKFQEIQ